MTVPAEPAAPAAPPVATPTPTPTPTPSAPVQRSGLKPPKPADSDLPQPAAADVTPAPTGTPAQKPADTPTPKPSTTTVPTPTAEEEPISLADTERMERMLEGLATKPVKSAEYLRRLAESDPEAAHVVGALLRDYKAKTASTKKMQADLEAREAAVAQRERAVLEEQDRFRKAIFESGFGTDPTFAPPGDGKPAAEPDWSAIGGDPAAFAKAVREQVLADLRGQLPEILKPVTEPAARMRQGLQQQAARMKVNQIIADTPDFADLKPDIDAFIRAENEQITARGGTKTPLTHVIDIVRGRRYARQQQEAAARGRANDTAQLDAATASGRGAGTRAVPTIPPEVRRLGAVAIAEYQDQLLEQGYTEAEIWAARNAR